MVFLSQNKMNHSFFPKKTLGQEPSLAVVKNAVFVDVGGTGDCGFRSIAAGIIDNFLNQPSSMRGEMLKQVLMNHFKYFPHHRITMPGLVKPADRMDQLIKAKKNNMGELVQTLAYTLRQMAVDELCAHPECYRGAFVKEHEQTSPENMRKASTWIDESSIAALSNALQMPVEVLIGDPQHSLRKRLRYNESATNPPVEMRLQGGHYIPRLVSGERFGLVRHQTAREVQPQVDSNRVDPSLPDILIKIAAEDKRLIAAFDTTYNRLAFMVANGELSKADLLSIYIRGMSESDYLSKRATHAGVEHGHQDFFNLISSAEKGEPRWVGSHQEMTDELIHAISRAISIGHMSEEVIDKKDAAQHSAP